MFVPIFVYNHNPAKIRHHDKMNEKKKNYNKNILKMF